MPKKLFTLFYLFAVLSACETINSRDWKDINEDLQNLTVAESGTFQVADLKFEILWQKQMVPNENLGYQGGIREMKIYKGDKLVNIFKDIVDPVGLGEINFQFYDFNVDGELDFRYPIDIGSIRRDKYIIYNLDKNAFNHQASWDYLRIQKINRKDKLILTEPEGMEGKDSQKVYSIKNNSIVHINNPKK